MVEQYQALLESEAHIHRGKIHDDSFGVKNFNKRFRRLDRLAVQTADDGTQFIILSFRVRDRAGNRIQVNLHIVIDPTLQREHVRRRKNLPPRTIPRETLDALLGF